MDAAPRFLIRTHGCQMNVHDSEKVANLLTHEGYRATEDAEDASLLIVNTCSIREKAEHRLYSDLGVLAEWKRERPGRVLGVAGCVAQQEGDRILRRFTEVDFVFGPQNVRLVPAMLAGAREGRRASHTEPQNGTDRFDLPERHPDAPAATPGRAFLTVMEGCDMFCSFCVVPNTRGREVSRPAKGILDEARALADGGVREITLLGQTVNAYGRHDARRGRSAEAGTVPFAELLAALDAIPGIERIRYTSPHPIFFDDAVVRAHGELASLCPHVHLPVQSGADAVLERMRRRYGRDGFLALCERLYDARPDLALTTDLIVGFPGESDRDFEDTLALVREARFVDGFSFKYSPRPQTKARELDGAVAPEVAQARLEVLQDQLRSQTLAYHRGRIGGRTLVRIEGRSRRGDQLAGRDPYHRVVNIAAGADSPLRPGAAVAVEIVEATPHSLIGEPIPANEASDRSGLLTPEPAQADEPLRSAASGG